MSAIQVGDRAPDFTLPGKGGQPVQLSALLKKGPVVLYFYPKDETRGCTAEACSFRDDYEDFKQAGAEVVGVSSDSTASHEQFATRHRLPFVLLSDTDSSVRKQYGVKPNFLGFLPGRVTYVIDRQGIVRHLFESQLQATRHVSEALEVLKRLKAA